MTRVLVLVPMLLYGCFLSNASSTKKLTDSVHEMNKAVRWGSLGVAIRMVEPGYRDRFADTHRHWGQLIQVADTDVIQLEMAPDGDSAVAMVAYQWYQADTLTLHQTVVRQRWSNEQGHYVLAGETVVQGDPRLLHPDAQAQPIMTDPASVTLMGLE